jgi:streptogramin lyase
VRKRISLVAALFAALLGSTTALATADGPEISEFGAGLTAGVGLYGITTGPDGNLWFSEETLGGVGRITPAAVITEFSAGFPTGSPRGIVTGPDGNLWVAMAGGNGAIAQVTRSGEVTEFPVTTPGDPTDIAVGPDNNLWYTDPASNLIGRITPSGSITEFPVPTDASAPTGIAKGPDGALWFTEVNAGQIGRITPTGDVTEFSSGISGGSKPTDIAKGPDGNLWFTENADPGAIGRITPKGVVTEFTNGLTTNAHPQGIAAGPDGNLWFTESKAPGAIGRITTDGDITEYSSGLLDIKSPFAITAGPDGNMWFTGSNIPGLVGRITLPPLVLVMAPAEVTTTSAILRGKLRANSQATDYHFEYGTTSAYGSSTEERYANSDHELTGVTAPIDGLAPGTTYHFRLVADNDSGETNGPDRVFTTASLPVETPIDPIDPVDPPADDPKPDFGETVVVAPEGTVRVKAPGGGWETMAPGDEMPLAATFDARQGAVSLTSQSCGGHTQTGHFGGGLFTLRQPSAACGRVDVYLKGGSFSSCPRPAKRRRARSGAVASASRTRPVRRLWGRDHGGSFRTHGRHSQATVRGTRWLTVDRCDGTLTRVTKGAVAVRDFRRHRTVLVRAGHSYLARAHPLPRRAHRNIQKRRHR